MMALFMELVMATENKVLTQQYLNQIKVNFDGDIDVSEAVQQVFSTDNSIYQQIPQAVVYPKHIEDLITLMKVLNEPRFKEVVLTPRGGGTGTNGQSLTNGIVVDLSRHMNKILKIDVEKRCAWVQAGVVKDQLNTALKKHGLFFAPELSTSNRATIGGMINTDASGQGSCRYGKTHHHVLGLKSILINGETLDTHAVSRQNIAREVQEKSTFQKTLYHKIFNLLDENKQVIQESFPALNRSLTGYDLPNTLKDDIFNLNNILCGSEGTLGFIAEAKLNLLPIPKYRLLINIGYANFQAALNDAKVLMQHAPLSIETIDSKVLNLAKNDIVWTNVAQYFPEENLEQAIQGINLVELDAQTEEELKYLEQEFLTYLAQDTRVVRLTTTVAWGEKEISHIYAMRKRSVGLLGNIKGEKRPQPFVEDTAVPPEYLADYIAEFRALLDSQQLDYGMFGHVDAGVLHVRPLMDMKDPQSLEQMQFISDQVVTLTHKYGGVIWGEHGKGLRSGYAPLFFGKAYPLLQKIKGLFDPHNQLNPGKIATPDTQPESKLITLAQVPLRGAQDRQIALKDWQSFGNAMHCNGNGACFNYDLDDPMCPSYKVTRDRKQSPKGRATLVKEWLRRENTGEHSPSFDHEVYDALHGCLSCKSCAGQCPVKVDIPDAKTQFLVRYHQRYKRQLRDYLIGNLESFIPKILPFKYIYNAMQQFSFMQMVQKKAFQLVDIPLFHPNANTDLKQYNAIVLKQDLSNLPTYSNNVVVIVQDAFTRYFETPVFLDFLTFLKKIGVTPYILPYLPNGKPLHVHGFLKAFEKKKQKCIHLFEQVAKTKIPMVGLDPAMTLVYRQEYQKGVGNTQYKVLMLQEWLSDYLKSHQPIEKIKEETFFLASHCTEKTQVPVSTKQWQEIFDHFGTTLEPLALGCCGMAGTYGHEAEHQTLSKAIYHQSWADKVKQYDQNIVATGYSCRSQIKRLDAKTIRHPIQILKELI